MKEPLYHDFSLVNAVQFVILSLVFDFKCSTQDTLKYNQFVLVVILPVMGNLARSITKANIQNQQPSNTT